MKTKISSHQLFIVVFLTFISTKFLFLPSLFEEDAKSNALFAGLGLFIVEAVVLYLITCAIVKHPEKKFHQLYENKFWKVFSKFIYVCVFVFYFFKIILLSNESFIYLRESVFAEADLQLFMVIFLFICSCLALSNITQIFRTCEFFYKAILVGLIVCLVIGLSSTELTTIGFSSKIPPMQVVFSAVKRCGWFGDFAFMILIMGRVQVDRKTKRLVSLGFFLATTVQLVVFVSFAGIYSYTASMHRFAISDLVVFASRSSVVGRLELIPILTIMFLISLQGGLFLYFCKMCLNELFPKVKDGLNIFFMDALICAMLFLFFTTNTKTFDFFTMFFCYFTIFIAFFIPILIALLFLRRRNENK